MGQRKKRGRGFSSDVKLVGSQVVHEWLNQEVGGEVEDQAKGDGDGESWQGLLEDGQQQQGQAQALGVTGKLRKWVTCDLHSWVLDWKIKNNNLKKKRT